MKSFKNKILKEGTKIMAQRPPSKDISNIVEKIEGGEIHMSEDRDKVQFATEIALKNANNQKLLNLQGSRPTKGNYDTLKRIESSQIPNAASRTLSRKFGADEDYVELHVYNLTGQLLQSIENFTEYDIPSVNNSDDKVNNFTIDPVEILTNLNYSTGQYKLILNIQKKQIFNSFRKIFTIKGISPSRQELNVSYNPGAPGGLIGATSSEIKDELGLFISRIEDSIFFKDFVLNFGSNNNELGINIALSNRGPELLIKLFEPLDTTINVGSTFRIATEITDPISMNVDLGEPETIDTSIQLQGPNYNVDTRTLNTIPSQYKTFDESLEYSLTSSYQHLLQQLENSDLPNVQYDFIREITDTASLDTAYHFENFVHFGSATERLKNFKYKLELVELYDSQITDINTIPGNASGSEVILKSIDVLQNKKTNLIKGLDGYESFLYFNSGTFAWPKINSISPYTLYATTSSQAKSWLGSDNEGSAYYGGQLLSSSLFDRQNPHNLVNLIPRHIIDNGDNNQGLLFSNMIGHHFDHIWTYIHHITQQKNSAHMGGISKNIVYIALKSLGIETFDQFENVNLIEYILGEGSAGNIFYDAPVSQSLITASNEGSIAKGDITRELWKRLYHNVPYLLKTKGTERGIHALMNCYGVPSTILNIKEYGGPVKDKSGYKTFSYDKYSYALTGDSNTTGYFIQTPWSSSNIPLSLNLSSSKTVEFRIKPHRSTEQYHLFGLSGSDATKDPHLVLTPLTGNDISSSGDSIQYGKIDLYINDIVVSSTSNFPVYNGSFWNIHIGTLGTSGSSSDIQFGAYQTNFLKNTAKYTSTISQTEADRALTFGDSFNGGGNSGALYAYLGGVPANPSAAYDTIDTLRYSGSFQELKYYFGELLSDNVLTQHSLEPSMYAGNVLSSSFDHIVLRLPLGSNNILHLDSGSYHPNQHTTYYLSSSISSSISSPIFKSFVEKHHLVTPDSVGASMSSEKIRLDEGDIDDNILSLIIKSETSTLDRQPQDYEDLGIFFSPQHEINEDIVYTLGGFKLDDYIGSPLKTEQLASNYQNLKTIRDEYFKKYKNHQRYNFWDYTKLIQYFDHTLFKIIEQYVPARANLKTGLLIEPHYLERNKFPIQVPTTEEFDTMLHDSHQTFFVDIDSSVSSSGLVIGITASIAVSTKEGVVLDEPQYGAQAPINPVQTTGIPFGYKPYNSSVLLGNALRGVPSNIYFRSLELGKEIDY
jgi:hypothetical protein